MEYKGIIKQRENWMTVVLFIASVFLLVREFMTGQYIYIPLVLLVMVACFFEKEHVVSEEGVDIKYIIFKKIVRHNYWRWNEITTIHPDYKPSQ